MKFASTVCVLFFSGIFTVTYASNFYVAAPKILRLNAEETVVIAMDGTAAALVNVNVQDHPQKTKTILSRQVELQPGKPKFFTIRLDPNNFPENFFTTPDEVKYVSLTANFGAFNKEIVVPVTSQSGYVLIQTDKPIYTPRQMVMFRIIPVSEEIRESKEPFHLIIKNPMNITVEEKKFNEKFQKLNKAFVSHIHRFPSNPLLGEWTAIVRYGHNMQHNSTVQFTVKEYDLVLTKFQNLRTYFQKELRKLKSLKSGSGNDSYTSKWIHFERLLFLQESMEPKFSSSNMAPSHDDVFCERSENELDVSVPLSSSVTIEGPCEVVESPSQKVTPKRKRVDIEELLKDASTSLNRLNAEQDSDETFGAHVAASLKNIKNDQHKELAKIKIMEIITEFRFKNV